ncbi:MAG: pseudouridine-5'-phosphate glycosidase [Anaerolineales bacterium]|nr:pseudouridine-5'-phosphate glycosidase [Anaerolineales bacterium]
MATKLPPFYHLTQEVSNALSKGLPVVALESTVITHGLPFPDNIQLANDMQQELWKLGVVPAMVAVLEGRIMVGMQADWLEGLAKADRVYKLSSRDLARAVVKKQSGGTTVAGTMTVAHQVGIQVFATGGIGGVHRGGGGDVSADLMQLAETPMVVVCAGAKAILDLAATLEYLETHNVLVVGYQTNDFPAFYSRRSGHLLNSRADSVEEVAEIARVHWKMGLRSAILVTVPIPDEVSLEENKVENAIQAAVKEASQKGLHGQEVTPYLLERVRQLTGGESLKANLGLLLNNTRVAGEIARFFAHSQMHIV